MKPFSKVLVSSIIAAAFMGGSAAWGASLSIDSLKTIDGHIMADITTQAGIGDFEDINGDALAAAFRSPSSVLALSDGSLLVADSRNHQIRKISNGKVTAFAGPELAIMKNDQGFPIGSNVDGKANESFFNAPAGLAADSKGNVYVADSANHSIRKIDASLQVSTLAGSGAIGSKDGNGFAAQFNHPNDVAAAADGSLYVADTLNHLIRKVSSDGTVTTLNAASARTIQVRPGQASFAGEYQDGSLKDAKFNEPSGLALDAKGNLYVSDAGNQRIRYIDLTAGTVTTVAGANLASDGKSQYDKDALYTPGDFADGDASKALFDFPKGIAVTSEGGLLIADSLNHSIRYLLNGKVSTITGTLKTGEADGVESAAEFYSPSDVTVLADGSIAVADAFNNKIRKISPYQLPKELPANEEVKVVIGNKVISFDAQPEIVNGRTMIPVRAITEALGYEVKYAEQSGTKMVHLIKGDATIELYIDKTEIKKIQKDQQDVVKTTDVAPYINSDRTYVPVRFFAEEIGLDVQWDQTTRTAILRQQSVVK